MFSTARYRAGVQVLECDLLAHGFVIGEGPRWRDDRLWFSDIFDGKIFSVSDSGVLELEAETDRPSGLGWLPDGSLLVATLSRETTDGRNVGPERLLCRDRHGWRIVVDLTGEDVSFNDMVVLGDGRAYVNLYRGTTGLDDEILLVLPDGTYRSVAAGLRHPNGMGVTADGRTLVVSETHANLVSAFDVERDGSLTNRRVFADRLTTADGLCVDAEGAVWVGCLFDGRFVRVVEGGELTHEVRMPPGHWALAPMLGGPDRRTLHMISADTSAERARRDDSDGYMWTTRVEVPGAGWP
jgi:sugar lactone lactonase YvrE